MSKYEENKAAKVGTEIICPTCGKPFAKKQYSQAFCCLQCKDKYWNTMGDRHKGPNEAFKKQQPKRPKDLEEAALSRMKDPDMYLSDAVIDEMGDELLKMAQFGAKWQKEQMMKEAVDADVMLTLHDKTGDISLHTGYLPKELGIKCDDKVRIIIVKEDEK